MCIHPQLSPQWLMIIVTPWPQSPPPPPPLVTCELPQSASCQWISVTGCGDLLSSQGRGQQQANMFRTISMEIIIPPSYWPHGWEWCYCSWAEDIWSRLRSPALNISALFLLPVNRYDSSLAKLTVMIQADPLTYLEFPRLWGVVKNGHSPVLWQLSPQYTWSNVCCSHETGRPTAPIVGGCDDKW